MRKTVKQNTDDVHSHKFGTFLKSKRYPYHHLRAADPTLSGPYALLISAALYWLRMQPEEASGSLHGSFQPLKLRPINLPLKIHNVVLQKRSIYVCQTQDSQGHTAIAIQPHKTPTCLFTPKQPANGQLRLQVWFLFVQFFFWIVCFSVFLLHFFHSSLSPTDGKESRDGRQPKWCFPPRCLWKTDRLHTRPVRLDLLQDWFSGKRGLKNK